MTIKSLFHISLLNMAAEKLIDGYCSLKEAESETQAGMETLGAGVRHAATKRKTEL